MIPFRVYLSLLALFVLLQYENIVTIVRNTNGYGAKIACSCHFLQNRSIADVSSKELMWPPISLITAITRVPGEDCVQANSRFFPTVAPRFACNKPFPHGCALLKAEERLPLRRGKVETTGLQTVDPSDDSTAIFTSSKVPIADPIIDEHFADDGVFPRALLIVNASTFPTTIMYERYGDSFQPTDVHLGWSMTKSLLGMLLGCLMKEKPEWFPNGLDTIAYPAFNLTVKHLIRMVDGFDWDEVYVPLNPAVNMLFGEDSVGSYSHLRLRTSPEQCFRYSSKATNMLSFWIKSQFAKESEYLQFPFKVLFDKINARSVQMETDPSNTFVLSSFSFMTARDWMRVGLLLINDGIWPGTNERVIPKSYMKELVTITKRSKGLYGMHFWLGGNDFDNSEEELACDELFPERDLEVRKWYSTLPKGTFFMSGFEGQYLMMIPSHKLVILRLGRTREKMPFAKQMNPKGFFLPILKSLNILP